MRMQTGETGRSESRRVALSRIAILLLAPEAGWLASWLLAVPGGQRALIEPALAPALVTGIVLFFSSLLLQGIPPLARRFRWEKIVESWTPYLRNGVLLLPASLFMGGIGGGLLVAQGKAHPLGIFVELAGLMVLLLVVLEIGRSANTKAWRLDAWLLPAAIALHVALIVLGRLLKVDPALAARSALLVQAMPFLGLCAGLALGPALLRPFTWRHIFDHRLPRRFRWALSILALTAILPLGGLAAPFWVWARRRLAPS